MFGIVGPMNETHRGGGCVSTFLAVETNRCIKLHHVRCIQTGGFQLFSACAFSWFQGTMVITNQMRHNQLSKSTRASQPIYEKIAGEI